MLEVDGLVENRPLYGCRVRPLTSKMFYNDQVLREAIECQVARLCSENISDAACPAAAAGKATRPDDMRQATQGPNWGCRPT